MRETLPGSINVVDHIIQNLNLAPVHKRNRSATTITMDESFSTASLRCRRLCCKAEDDYYDSHSAVATISCHQQVATVEAGW